MQEWEQEEAAHYRASGKGSYLIDTEGKRYLDGTSSIWVNLHGHRHPALDRAIKKQLEKVAHSRAVRTLQSTRRFSSREH